MSNTNASLYVGFSVFFLIEVFLFFSLLPSHMREAFTYGSEEETVREEEKDKEDGDRKRDTEVRWEAVPKKRERQRERGRKQRE